jgi:hypothetical protein
VLCGPLGPSPASISSCLAPVLASVLYPHESSFLVALGQLNEAESSGNCHFRQR